METFKYLFLLVLFAFVMVGGLVYFHASSDQALRTKLRQHGDRTSGTIKRMWGRYNCCNGNTIDLHFFSRYGEEISTSYGGGLPFPERPLLRRDMRVSIVYDPKDPSHALPEPLTYIPQRNPRKDVLDYLMKLLKASLVIFPLGFLQIWQSERRKLKGSSEN